MRKIKVLHIIKSLGRGGAEMLLPETLKLHDKEKFEFHFIYFLPWKNQMVEAISEAGGKITCFSARNNIELILQHRKVVRYCNDNNIDVIHCHLPWAGFLGRLVHLETKIPLIYTEHSLQDQYHLITKTLNKWSYNFQSMALGVSRGATDSIKNQIKPKVPVITLFNGVDTNFYSRNNEDGASIRKEMGIPETALVIGAVAVFRKPKRLVEWLRVFKAVEKNSSNVFGILVGAGPLEPEIKAEVERLDLEKKVFLPGLQTKVKPFLSAMDIFMMTSSFEGLPVALLEAMSMKCAVVCTDAGGIKEVVRNREDGLTCNVNELKNLSSLCLELVDSPTELEVYKRSARKRVVSNFSLKKMVVSLEKIYDDQFRSQNLN